MIFDIRQRANERRIERARKKNIAKYKEKNENRIKNKISQNYQCRRKNAIGKHSQISQRIGNEEEKRYFCNIQLFFRARQYKHWTRVDHFQVHLRTSVLISAPNASILNTKSGFFNAMKCSLEIFFRVIVFLPV